jgi:hypothetical protein
MVPVVSLDEFRLALAQISAAVSVPGKLPPKSIDVYDEVLGETLNVSLKDTVITRAMVTLVRHFEQDTAQAIALRLSALSKLMQRPELTPWAVRGEDKTELSDALVYAAARAPLSFPSVKFKLHEIVSLARGL